MYFSQMVPNPAGSTLRIASEYRMAMGKYHPELNYSHASFESFISGRFIVMAATRALELQGWPLTRANFLDAIFRHVRTFDVLDYKMGPYGDGVGTYLNRQTEDDWCNQGAHEVFITQMTLNNGKLEQEGQSSYSLETMDNVFEGFVIGKFLSLVVSELQGEVVTPKALLDTIYAKKYFHLGGNIVMGPFLDEASGERKCNQGMDSVYVTRWGGWSWDYVPFDSSDDKHRCGNEFDPDPVASQGRSDHNIVIISTVVPGAILCASILVAAAITKRARPSLKKMKRSELEIGETIGKGQFGSVHSGDWNGTPVAIRVIDNMAASKEDLRIIKGEMELTHNLHHPNLLMLLGYCESKDDLLIVYEYMATGSVHEYLKRNLHNMNFFNKVAIAFIDGSMVTKICDFWCWQKQPERRPSVFQILRNWPQTFASAGVFQVPSDISISSPSTRQMFSEIQTDVDVVQGPQEGFDEMMVAVVPQQLSAALDSTGGMQGGVDLTLASFTFSTESPKGITSENHSSVV
eukprot:m51a1_g11236 putative serine threonine protein kinase (519) ;mRNA; r:13584-16932